MAIPRRDVVGSGIHRFAFKCQEANEQNKRWTREEIRKMGGMEAFLL